MDNNDALSDYRRLTRVLSRDTLEMLSARGTEWFTRVGIDVIRAVVLDVMTGRNIRSATEILTRCRIAALNLATVNLFLQGSVAIDNFVERLPHLASEALIEGKLSKAEKWLGQWILGLTDKGFQNILRDDYQLIAGYRESYVETCREVIANHIRDYGNLTGTLQLDTSVQAEINWLLMVYLLNTIGSQTLTIRGSDKSTYGKLFEKLVLGSLLHVLDFEYASAGKLDRVNRVFWLSSSDEKRESDATLLYEAGKGVRFDIGFIGRGNPEISLDKVTRYQREVNLGRTTWYMATIIVVDRIGQRSRIERLAKEIGGTIIQMSLGYWPQRVARTLNEVLGYEHPLVNMEQSDIEEYLRGKLQDAPLEEFIRVTAKDSDLSQQQE